MELDELTQNLRTMIKEASEPNPHIVGYRERIDEIREESGDKMHPMLLHYLEKGDYVKALRFLETRISGPEEI